MWENMVIVDKNDKSTKKMSSKIASSQIFLILVVQPVIMGLFHCKHLDTQDKRFLTTRFVIFPTGLCSWQLQSSGSWGVVLERDKEHRLVAKTQDIIDLLFPLLTYFTHERLLASSKFSFGFIETTSFQATRSANLKRVSKCVQDKGQIRSWKMEGFWKYMGKYNFV